MALNVKHLLLASIVFCLAACGASSEPGTTVPASSTSSQGTQNPQSIAENTRALSLIAGIYDTTRGNDESYLHIDADGNVTPYDYLGDGVGSGANCYQIPTMPSQINTTLNEGVIAYSESTGVYTLTNDLTQLEFMYTAASGLSDFVYNGTIRAGTGINISSNNLNLKIGGEGGRLQTAMMISDILSLLCS